MSRITERYKAGLRGKLYNVFMQHLPAGSRVDTAYLLNQSGEDYVVRNIDDNEMLEAVHEKLEECCRDVEEYPGGEKEEKSVILPPAKQ